MTILLERSDAICIFSSVVYVYENSIKGNQSSIENNFNSKRFLKNIFKTYSDKESAELITFAVFKIKTKKFHSFRAQAQKARFVPIKPEDVKCYINYVKENNNGLLSEEDLEQLDSIYEYKLLPARPENSDLSYAFQGSKWRLFHSDFLKEQTGISQALLVLDNFGQAYLKNKKNNNTLPQVYFGSYKLHKKSFLKVSFRKTNEKSAAKYLDMFFYVGDNLKNDMYGGSFQSIDKKIFFGVSLIQRIPQNKKIEGLTDEMKFYPFESEFNQLAPEISNFFKRSPRKLFTIPTVYPEPGSLDSYSGLLSGC